MSAGFTDLGPIRENWRITPKAQQDSFLFEMVTMLVGEEFLPGLLSPDALELLPVEPLGHLLGESPKFVVCVGSKRHRSGLGLFLGKLLACILNEPLNGDVVHQRQPLGFA